MLRLVFVLCHRSNRGVCCVAQDGPKITSDGRVAGTIDVNYCAQLACEFQKRLEEI